MKYVRPVNHDIVPYKHFTRRDVTDASSIFHSVFLEVLSGDWTPAYYLPLEVVLSHPGQLVVPRVARRWHIDSTKAIFFGLPQLKPKMDLDLGWMSTPSYYLVEHFDDFGDDGHTHYRPAGWLIVDSDQCELMSDINAARVYSLDYVSLPEFKPRTKVQADLVPELPEIAEPALVPPVKRVRRAAMLPAMEEPFGTQVPVDGSVYHPDDDFPPANFDDLSPSPAKPDWVRSPDLDGDIAESLGGDPYLVAELQFDVSSFELGVVDVNAILNDKSLDGDIAESLGSGTRITGELIVNGPTVFGVDLSTGGTDTGRMPVAWGETETDMFKPAVTGHSVSGQFWPSPAGDFRVETNAMSDGSLTIHVSSDDPKVDLRKHAESIAEWALGQVSADKSGSFEIKVTGPLPSETRLIDSGDDL